MFTAASGIVPQITDWHNENDVHRDVFVNVPGPLQVMFYTVIPVMLAWGAFRFADRMKNWERGGPAPTRRTTAKNAKRRLADFRAGVYMRTLLRDSAAGLMHSMIYFGFLVLLGVTTVLEVDHQLPEDLKFLHGRTYLAYSFVGDAAGVVFVGGIVWAIVRRYVQRPYRIRIKTKAEHALILGTFLADRPHRLRRRGVPHRPRGKSRLRGVELHRLPAEPARRRLRRSTRCRTGTRSGGSATSSAFIAFLAILPDTMLRHMFTSPLNMYLARPRSPEGRDEADAEPDGDLARDVRRIRRRGLHVEAAARHRRLHDVRPLHERVPGARHRQAARPREIVLKVGEVMAATGKPGRQRRRSAPTATSRSAPTRVFERITADEIWACTSCKACDEICPVNIEILDKILDMRRYLSLMESNFPAELGNAYRAMENQGNPWG